MYDEIMTEFIVPYGQSIIGEKEFYFCRDLEKIYIPHYVKEIPKTNFIEEGAVFMIPRQIHPLTIFGERETAAERCAQDAGLIFEETDRWEDGDVLKAYFGQSKNVKIGSHIRVIRYDSFHYAPDIEEVELSFGLELIDSATFQNTKIREIVIPKSVKNIGSRTFKDCKNLKCVAFENGDTTFEIDCFDGCSEALVIKAPSGGFVENFSKKYSIHFESIS